MEKTSKKERTVKTQVKGFPTQDGGGVNLIRVLGHDTVGTYDPILMLDSFDSMNPDDYTKGFPMHPHRGIETISYVSKGNMVHRDSLGNEDSIADGEVQWMTAGSGILHEEQLPPAERMLGVQLWLNLPAKDKMTAPSYHSIKNAEIEEITWADGKLRLLAGTYQDKTGHMGDYLPLDYYDIHLNPHGVIELDTDPERSVMVFTLLGTAVIGGQLIPEKTAATLTGGDRVIIKAAKESTQILFISSLPLHEPVVWGGPIVMNTKEELNEAFSALKRGDFVQTQMTYDY